MHPNRPANVWWILQSAMISTENVVRTKFFKGAKSTYIHVY